MKILVSGSAGFIASHLVDALLAIGHEVAGVDNLSAGHLSNLYQAAESSKFTFLCQDINMIDPTKNYDDEHFDVVFHLAASKKIISMANSMLDLETNAGGTLRLLECAWTWNARFIHFSTGSVYGNSAVMAEDNGNYDPVSHYGVSKLAGERYAMLYHRMYGLPVTVLRPFHVYGPRQESAEDKGGVIGIWCRQMLRNRPLTVFGDGQQTRTFTHVNDVVKAALFALEKPETIGQVYNVSSGEVVSLLDVLEIMKPESVVYGPETPGDIRDFSGVRNDKLKALGFEFQYSLKGSLPEVLDWYRKNYEA